MPARSRATASGFVLIRVVAASSNETQDQLRLPTAGVDRSERILVIEDINAERVDVSCIARLGVAVIRLRR